MSRRPLSLSFRGSSAASALAVIASAARLRTGSL